jgi:hypothetical protein
LTIAEFETFSTTIENLKTRSRHVSPMGKYIQFVFGGFKSHDYHILMQQPLPLALRRLLASGRHMTMMRVSKVLMRICNKVRNPFKIDSIQIDVAISLALVEIHFPPSFFYIMTHLFIYHLVDEVDLCGLVSTKWMHPMERYMKTLKTYVNNIVRLEESMAEGYI